MIRGSVSGQDHIALFRAICGSPSLLGVPTRMEVGGLAKPGTSDWRERLLVANREGFAFWRDENHVTTKGFSYLPRSEIVLFTLPVEGELEAQTQFVESLPFELAALTSPQESYWIAAKKQRWGFARTHVRHGWACAFRGAGYDRLVSRRWLDFGPWRVIRRPDDTTFIQFHDLAITDPEEAYAQAAPGHQRMGIDATGGFIQAINEDAISALAARCTFSPKTRTLELPIAPRYELTQQEMLTACSLRLHSRTHGERIDHLAFVFMDQADAERHLHELWLREIEVWYLDGGGKHRIDADYHPTPDPPAWVRRLG